MATTCELSRALLHAGSGLPCTSASIIATQTRVNTTEEIKPLTQEITYLLLTAPSCDKGALCPWVGARSIFGDGNEDVSLLVSLFLPRWLFAEPSPLDLDRSDRVACLRFL